MSRPGLALLPQGRYASRKAAGTRLWRSPEGLDCHRQRARQALGRDNPNDGPTGTAGKARTGGKPGRQSGAWKARTPCKPGRQARTPDNPERRTNRNGRESPNGSQAARQAGRQPGSEAARQAGRQSRTEITLNPQPNPKNTAQPEEQRSNQPQPESTPTQPEDHRPTHNQPQQRPQNPRPRSTKQAHSPHYPNPPPHPGPAPARPPASPEQPSNHSLDPSSIHPPQLLLEIRDLIPQPSRQLELQIPSGVHHLVRQLLHQIRQLRAGHGPDVLLDIHPGGPPTRLPGSPPPTRGVPA